MIRRNRRRTWLFALPAALAAFAAPLRAVPITFAYRGTVTDVFVAPNVTGVPAADWPAPGTAFEGTYTFESTAPDTNPNAFLADYLTSPGGDFHAAAGAYRWYSPSSLINISDSGIAGAEELYSATDGPGPMQLVSHPQLAAFFDQWDLFVTLRGQGAMLNGPQLPLTPPSLAAATATRAFFLYGDNSADPTQGPTLTISGTLDSLTLVPEPATCAALVAALAWGLARRDRRATRCL